MPVYQQALSFMKQSEIEIYNDYELIYLAKENHDIAYEILQKKYEPIIVNIARRMKRAYPNFGLDIEDYVLEGKLALTNAIYNYNEQYDNLFFTYVTKCINLAILTTMQKNKKDSCLNNALEWTDEIKNNKENLIGIKIQLREIINKTLKYLKPIERKILYLRLKGYTYIDIAKKLNIEKKKVDNVLLKIRKIMKDYRKE